MEIAPEITEIERRASEAGVDIASVLKRADVAPTTWWRWAQQKNEPRMATLRKLRAALESEIAGRGDAA